MLESNAIPILLSGNVGCEVLTGHLLPFFHQFFPLRFQRSHLASSCCIGVCRSELSQGINIVELQLERQSRRRRVHLIPICSSARYHRDCVEGSAKGSFRRCGGQDRREVVYKQSERGEKWVGEKWGGESERLTESA